MANINTTARPKATVESSSNPVVYNVTCTLANTEYSQVLNTSAKKFLIRVRGNAVMRLAFDSGGTVVSWITIPFGCSYIEEALLFSGTLYFQTSKPAQVVEILEWT